MTNSSSKQALLRSKDPGQQRAAQAVTPRCFVTEQRQTGGHYLLQPESTL
ncbi:hypothetical protein [Arsukibacterium sp.]|nr:hypothetical protein [Arsukibacterium sp.]